MYEIFNVITSRTLLIFFKLAPQIITALRVTFIIMMMEFPVQLAIILMVQQAMIIRRLGSLFLFLIVPERGNSFFLILGQLFVLMMRLMIDLMR